eukprot:5346441-Lingulodinium_polyedra.AAC.1
MKARLKHLRAPQYGTKAQLWERLIKWEAFEQRRLATEAHLEARRATMAQSSDPVVPQPVPGPEQPTEQERA